MTEKQTSTGAAPSAEELKERVEDMGQQQTGGAGDQEPDPVTAEAPPRDIQAGDKERTQT